MEQKMPRKISKKGIERKKLKEWKTIINKNDNCICQVCKKDLKNKPRNCHAHHILDKHTYPELKFDVRNGITLCYSCHKVGKYAAHLNAIFFANWLKENRLDIYKYLKNFI